MWIWLQLAIIHTVIKFPIFTGRMKTSIKRYNIQYLVSLSPDNIEVGESVTQTPLGSDIVIISHCSRSTLFTSKISEPELVTGPISTHKARAWLKYEIVNGLTIFVMGL